MNLILLFNSDQKQGNYLLQGDRAQHIHSVLKAEPGKILRVGLLNGPLGSATVLECQADHCLLEVEFEEQTPPRPLNSLVLAIPRPKSLKKLLPEVTAFGLDKLFLTRTWRVARPFLTAPILNEENYLPLLHDGLMQSRLSQLPELHRCGRFNECLEYFQKAPTNDERRLVAHPSATTPLSQISLGRDTPVTLAIGPEGGFIPQEVDGLANAGFVPVSMGPRILRVETACVALLAQLELLRQLGNSKD